MLPSLLGTALAVDELPDHEVGLPRPGIIHKRGVSLSQIERPFHIDELFFSSTDHAGVITSGNDVFARVSGYDLETELIRKPHNIIRHPDMPRAVFKLLWDYLKESRSIACYVKNKAKDGDYYWVVAVVVPIHGGYLSVRFKPSSHYFDTVRGVYAEMLNIERAAGQDPEGRREGMRLSGEHLRQALEELGFAGYSTFMLSMLATELAERDRQLRSLKANAEEDAAEDNSDLCGYAKVGECLDSLFASVEGLLEIIEKLTSKSEFLYQLAQGIHLNSMNAMILSSQLGDTGKTLMVVADRMATIANLSATSIADMTREINDIVVHLREKAFLIAVSKLQLAMTIFFTRELLSEDNRALSSDHPRISRDIKHLSDSYSTAIINALDMLEGLQRKADSLKVKHRGFSKTLKNLKYIHLAGKVEVAKLQGTADYATLFDELFALMSTAERELADFKASIDGLGDFTSRIRRVEATLRPAMAAAMMCQDNHLLETSTACREV